MALKTVWLPLAVFDLRAIYEYIFWENPHAARGVYSQILNSVKHLEDYPHSGRAGRISGTREFIIPNSPYIIPYRVRENRLEILGVHHSRRKWPDTF